MSRRQRKKRAVKRRKYGISKWSVWKQILLSVIVMAALVFSGIVLIVMDKYSRIEIEKLDVKALSISEEVKSNSLDLGSGYLNVALFGVDSREGELGKGTLSDAILVASLNLETKEIKMISLYRDTLLNQEGDWYSKANAAYALGGPQEAVAMLNRNLDLNIEHYIAINFNVMMDVVDLLGGVEVDIEEEEIPYLNRYCIELMRMTEKVTLGITEPGRHRLNGIQATAYVRIRYTAGGDFKRTERQRIVLTEMVKSIQQSDLITLNSVINEVFGAVATNFELGEIIKYASGFLQYRLGESVGFPFDHTETSLTGIGSVVIPDTLEDNVSQLHEFLFGIEEYIPTETVQNISQEIIKKVGTIVESGRNP